MPTINAVDPFSFLGDNSNAAFLSKATLLNVKKLELQRIGDRCVGLLINRHTGIQETLGQWDPCNEETSLLYDYHMGCLTSLTFLYSDPPPKNERRGHFFDTAEQYEQILQKERYITDILIAPSPPPQWARPSFTWSDLSSVNLIPSFMFPEIYQQTLGTCMVVHTII